MTYDEMVAAILGGPNNMETKQVPLTTDEITLLRDALNLAAEYSADVDDSEHYDEDDWDTINAKINRFRQLDDYLKQFEANDR